MQQMFYEKVVSTNLFTQKFFFIKSWKEGSDELDSKKMIGKPNANGLTL